MLSWGVKQYRSMFWAEGFPTLTLIGLHPCFVIPVVIIMLLLQVEMSEMDV